MDDVPEKRDWSEIESAMQDDEDDLPQGSMAPDAAGDAPTPVEKRSEEVKGILAKFQKNQIERRTAIAEIEEWYEGRLEIAEEKIKQAVKVHKAEARKSAERFLGRIDAEHLDFMQELGLRNADRRQKALNDLYRQTTENLESIQNADMPEPMVDEAVTDLMDIHRRFAEKLKRELSEDTDRKAE